ncbi:polyphenol oxidase family protein [Elusimicrobiota bacterium]
MSEVSEYVRNDLILLQQIHGASFSIIDERSVYEEAIEGVDGAIFLCKKRQFAVGIRIADCLPVIVTLDSRLYAAFHSGWKSLAAGIVGEFMRLTVSMGYDVKKIRVFVGPHICKNCYEVGEEMSAFFKKGFVMKGKLDLFAVLTAGFEEYGVSHESIKYFQTSNICTFENEEYSSYRRGDRNRMMLFAIQH